MQKEMFQNIYSMSKTLRFELKPVGSTLENFKLSDILEQDSQKSSGKREVQYLFDENFKKIIEEKLFDLELDQENLIAVYENNGDFDKAVESLKKQIVSTFKSNEFKSNYLQTAKHFDKLVEKYPNNQNVLLFKKFTSYFTNFFEIRKHIFEGTDSGTIASRIVEDNLPFYLSNMDRIKKLPKELKQSILLDSEKISSINHFSDFLSQSGITEYNKILGGYTLENGEKIQGINEKINLYSQATKQKLPKLSLFYKMILSEEMSSSFVLDAIETDEDLVQNVKAFLQSVQLNSTLNLAESERIFVKYAKIGYLPKVPYYLFHKNLIANYDFVYLKKNSTKTYEKNREMALKNAKYSLQKIQDTLESEENSELIIQALKEKYESMINEYEMAKKKFASIDWNESGNIRRQNESNVFKELFDALQMIKQFYDVFEMVDEVYNPDPSFYNELQDGKNQLGLVFTKLYNQVRNYITKKSFSNEKIKLNFNNPTLANGWDANKEMDNSSFILRKYNEKRKAFDYYLGIWNSAISKKLKKTEISEKGIYEKLNYKLFPDPSKMLPKLFVKSKKWQEKYPLSPTFMKKYDDGLHKKGENFDLEFLHELIDYLKDGLKNHPNNYQETFHFQLKATEKYTAYTEFIRDIEASNYAVSFDKILDVQQLVDDATLFLFQIWSKDYSTYSKGTKNLNTIYFESLFSPENMKENTFKLSGGAEIFYRPASIDYSKEKREQGHHSEELKTKFTYPIVKDRRYSEDKFFFHVPLVMNYRAKELSPKQLNQQVNDSISDFTHIIGIDRGERHLVYLSVVEIKTGRIVEQKHLDEIVSMDTKNHPHTTSYLKKLEIKSKNREEQRKSWKEIETIKELKEGYISQLVNEIRQMQQKYNALIVFENLNKGFKNSRIKIEKQIYQKFELALIKKFNYLIDKSDEASYTKGLQLTNPITTLDKIGNQTGVIFYIPAWNTSKIDPTTGFVNLFRADDLRYKNLQQVKEFIEKIDEISFEKNEIKFSIDFNKWNDRYPNSRKKWVLSTQGERVYSFRNPEKQNQWDYKLLSLTDEFKAILTPDGKLKNETAENGKQFMKLFKLLVSLRNSIPGQTVDYLVSPVMNSDGVYFDSRNQSTELLPVDADANGAYNIARKGIMAIENLKAKKEKPFYITNEEYLAFIQKQNEK